MQWSNTTPGGGQPPHSEEPGLDAHHTGNWTRDHWPRVYVAILNALDPHPQARRALRDALNALCDEIHRP